MIILYGIKNCDTIKKARKWLECHDIDYQFHDFRKDGIDEKLINQWCEELNWETLLNKRGTTWRKLPEDTKNTMNQSNAIKIMLDQPAIIKRPVLDIGIKRVVGYSEDTYTALFN